MQLQGKIAQHHSCWGILYDVNLGIFIEVYRDILVLDKFKELIHECNYCYENTSKEIAKKNYKIHLENKNNESIIIK